MPERQRDRRRDDDQLPAPEVDPAQQVAEHPRLAEPLRRIVDRGEDRVAGEGEDHGVGVQGPQPAEGEPRCFQVGRPPGQLKGDYHAHQHSNYTPDDRGDDELPRDRVVVGELSILTPITSRRAFRIGTCAVPRPDRTATFLHSGGTSIHPGQPSRLAAGPDEKRCAATRLWIGRPKFSRKL